jgi:hypothetical protein
MAAEAPPLRRRRQGAARIRPSLRHSEILAPQGPEATPEQRRRALRALLLLAVIAVLVQPLSVPAGRYLTSKVYSGTDAYSEWAAYAASPPPDVLFLGPSEARTDVDTAQMSRLLSAQAGHPVTVGKLGFSAQGPAFLELVMYRIMHQPRHPKVIVRTVETPMFNANGTCQACLTDQSTFDVWEISDLTDPAFVRLALANASNPARLVAGWALPAIAYYPSIAAVNCSVVRRGRTLAQSAFGSVPWELEVSTPCELGAPAHPSAVMTADARDNISQSYREMLTRQYRLSPQLVGDEMASVRRAQAGGTRVIFLKPPFHSLIRTANPPADAEFDGQMSAISAQLGVSTVDLAGEVPDDSRYWVDPLHLNLAGAAYFAPTLAAALSRPLAAAGL